MYTMEKRHLKLYENVKPFIECSCGNADWVEQYHEPTGLTTVYCKSCNCFMTVDQFVEGLQDYEADIRTT